MNGTYIQSPTDHILHSVRALLSSFTPELHKAAAYLLENPNEISISSIRELAQAARVKPNTLVRMAKAVGFAGYDEFREPFREAIRQGETRFPDRARQLQSVSQRGKMGGLYADMARSAMANIEQTFADADAVQLQAAAQTIIRARHTWVLGVGINFSLARTFTYLTAMALENLTALPRGGSSALDDLVHANSNDTLLAMTFKPYRQEIIDAVSVAHEQGVTVVALSDSPACPIFHHSQITFTVPTQTPQFFTSTFAAGALLETLAAFVIANTGETAVRKIEKVDKRRYALGIYQADP